MTFSNKEEAVLSHPGLRRILCFRPWFPIRATLCRRPTHAHASPTQSWAQNPGNVRLLTQLFPTALDSLARWPGSPGLLLKSTILVSARRRFTMREDLQGLVGLPQSGTYPLPDSLCIKIVLIQLAVSAVGMPAGRILDLFRTPGPRIHKTLSPNVCCGQLAANMKTHKGWFVWGQKGDLFQLKTAICLWRRVPDKRSWSQALFLGNKKTWDLSCLQFWIFGGNLVFYHLFVWDLASSSIASLL